MEDKDIKIQIAIATLKSTLGNIPVVGGFLNEYLFEVRGKVKQERLNKFVAGFAEYLTQLKEVTLRPEQIEKEEFGDFFEEVIKKVTRTSSETKKEAFKKLLANQLIKPKDYDYAEMILEIIGSLHETQILLLNNLYKINYEVPIDKRGVLLEKQRIYQDLIKQRSDLFFQSKGYDNPNDDPQVKTMNRRVSDMSSEIYKLKFSLGVDPHNDEIETSHQQKTVPTFLLQDLCNKGLAIDISMKYGSSPFELVKISNLGIDLLKMLP